MDIQSLHILGDLGVALSIGLLVGIERGWSERDGPVGSRLAGLRTFALVGLYGGLLQLLGPQLSGNSWLPAAGLLGLLVLITTAHYQASKLDKDMGLTTVIAVILVCLLGMLPGAGHHLIAVIGAVVLTVLLYLKTSLHRWLQQISAIELGAILKFLVITAVILPVLPNQAMGPWLLLNPFKIWLLVVMIVSISLVAFLSIRLLGSNRGILLTSLMGGLASSTAVTLTLSRLNQLKPSPDIMAAGVLLSSAILFPRVLFEISVVNHLLLPDLWLPMSSAALLLLTGCLLLVRRSWREGQVDIELKNPFQLSVALQFAGLLVAIFYAAEAGHRWFGDAGLYLVAVLSGFADVDAICLSVAEQARRGLESSVAVNAIMLAVLSNTCVKAGLTVLIGGWLMGGRVLLVVGLTLLIVLMIV